MNIMISSSLFLLSLIKATVPISINTILLGSPSGDLLRCEALTIRATLHDMQSFADPELSIA